MSPAFARRKLALFVNWFPWKNNRDCYWSRFLFIYRWWWKRTWGNFI